MKVWELSKKILGIGLVCLPLTMSTSLTGCLTDDDKDTAKGDTTPVVETTPWPTEMTLTVGGQGHKDLGSALELDTGKVYLSGVANTNLASVDAVLLYYSDAWHIENTKTAKASGATHKINLTDSYSATSVKENTFVKVSSRPANQEAGKDAYSKGSKLQTSTIAANDIFIVQTTNGKLVLLTVSSVTGATSAGAADFKLSIGSLTP